MRLDSDGTPDSAFGGGDGIVTDGLPAETDPTSVALQGSAILVGATSSSGDFAAWRFKSDGTPDTTFGTAGVATISASPNFDYAHALAVQPDGKIVLAGEYSVFNAITATSTGQGAVARLTANGAPDTSFGGGDGVVLVGGAAGDTTLKLLALDPSGKIVVAGASAGTANVLRFNADGSPDTSFDSDGTLSLDAGTTLTGLAVSSDGRLFLGGYTTTVNPLVGTSVTANLLYRRNSDGSPDTTFAADGKVTLPGSVTLPTLGPIAYGEGRLTAVGTVFTTNDIVSDTNLFLTRYIVNLPPVARHDNNYSTNEDTAVKLDVLANDTVEPGETKTITFIQPPPASVGTVVRTDQFTKLLFTPAPNFNGKAVFKYTVSDNNGGSAVANVTVMVNPVNDPPVNTVPKSASVVHDGFLVFSGPSAIHVSDVDAGSAAEKVVLSSSLGKLYLFSTAGLTSVAGSGSSVVTLVGKLAALNDALAGLVFRPTPGKAGNGRVTITTYDLGNTGAGGPKYDRDVIPVTVQDAAPSFNAQFALLPEYRVAAGATLTVPKGQGVLVHVSDTDGDPFTARLTYAPAVGKLRLAADGSFTYAAPKGYKGVVLFIVKAYDGIALSNPIIAVIRVG